MGIFCSSCSTKYQVHDNNLVCNSNGDVKHFVSIEYAMLL